MDSFQNQELHDIEQNGDKSSDRQTLQSRRSRGGQPQKHTADPLNSIVGIDSLNDKAETENLQESTSQFLVNRAMKSPSDLAQRSSNNASKTGDLNGILQVRSMAKSLRPGQRLSYDPADDAESSLNRNRDQATGMENLQDKKRQDSMFNPQMKREQGTDSSVSTSQINPFKLNDKDNMQADIKYDVVINNKIQSVASQDKDKQTIQNSQQLEQHSDVTFEKQQDTTNIYADQEASSKHQSRSFTPQKPESSSRAKSGYIETTSMSPGQFQIPLKKVYKDSQQPKNVVPEQLKPRQTKLGKVLVGKKLLANQPNPLAIISSHATSQLTSEMDKMSQIVNQLKEQQFMSSKTNFNKKQEMFASASQEISGFPKETISRHLSLNRLKDNQQLTMQSFYKNKPATSQKQLTGASRSMRKLMTRNTLTRNNNRNLNTQNNWFYRTKDSAISKGTPKPLGAAYQSAETSKLLQFDPTRPISVQQEFQIDLNETRNSSTTQALTNALNFSREQKNFDDADTVTLRKQVMDQQRQIEQLKQLLYGNEPSMYDNLSNQRRSNDAMYSIRPKASKKSTINVKNAGLKQQASKTQTGFFDGLNDSNISNSNIKDNITINLNTSLNRDLPNVDTNASKRSVIETKRKSSISPVKPAEPEKVTIPQDIQDTLKENSKSTEKTDNEGELILKPKLDQNNTTATEINIFDDNLASTNLGTNRLPTQKMSLDDIKVHVINDSTTVEPQNNSFSQIPSRKIGSQQYQSGHLSTREEPQFEYLLKQASSIHLKATAEAIAGKQTKKFNKDVHDINMLKKDLRKFQDDILGQDYDDVKTKELNEKGLKNLGTVAEILGNHLPSKHPIIEVMRKLKKQIEDDVQGIIQRFEKSKTIQDLDSKNKMIVISQQEQKIEQLELQLEYEKNSLQRFLQSSGKLELYQDMQDWEQMKPLDTNDILIEKFNKGKMVTKGAVYDQAGLGSNKDQHQEPIGSYEELSKYSDLKVDLQSQFTLLNSKASTMMDKEVTEILQNLALSAQINEHEVITMVEASLMHCFKGLQKETAAKVLRRCIKRVIQEDKSTQMGHDMFTEERLNYEARIAEMKTIIQEKTQRLAQQNKRIEKLDFDKGLLQRELQEHKHNFDELHLDHQKVKGESKILKTQQLRFDEEYNMIKREVDYIKEKKDALSTKLVSETHRADKAEELVEHKRKKHKHYKSRMFEIHDKHSNLEGHVEQLSEQLNLHDYRFKEGKIRVLHQYRKSKKEKRTKVHTIVSGRDFPEPKPRIVDAKQLDGTVKQVEEQPGENDSQYSVESEFIDAPTFFKNHYRPNDSVSLDDYDDFWEMEDCADHNHDHDVHAENFIHMLTDDEYFKVFTALGWFNPENIKSMNKLTDPQKAMDTLKKWYLSHDQHQERLHNILEKKRKKSKIAEISSAIDESERKSMLQKKTQQVMHFMASHITERMKGFFYVQENVIKHINELSCIKGKLSTIPTARHKKQKSSTADDNKTLNKKSRHDSTLQNSRVQNDEDDKPYDDHTESIMQNSIEKDINIEQEIRNIEKMNLKDKTPPEPERVFTQKENEKMLDKWKTKRMTQDVAQKGQGTDSVEIDSNLDQMLRMSKPNERLVQTDIELIRQSKMVDTWFRIQGGNSTSTQTQECYFPFDERTRDAIATVLGHRGAKSSDVAINNIMQSFFNQLKPEDYHLMFSTIVEKRKSRSKTVPLKQRSFAPILRPKKQSTGVINSTDQPTLQPVTTASITPLNVINEIDPEEEYKAALSMQSEKKVARSNAMNTKRINSAAFQADSIVVGDPDADGQIDEEGDKLTDGGEPTLFNIENNQYSESQNDLSTKNRSKDI